jgi:iron complex outermembrane recepter protein
MNKNPKLQFGAGAVALLLATLTPALAQTSPVDSTTTTSSTSTTTTTTATPTTTQVNSAGQAPVVQLAAMTVVGEQASLASAEEIKQGSQVMVDSIVADDIDKLPDVNVSYALERITGVQVAHVFAGVGGNGAVTIDGLTQVENTIDGRDVFTAGGTSGGGVGNGQRTFD